MTRQNPRSSSEAIARRAKRGFSLIEAAIVLGVVGAVIGTIWVSAANMYESYKVNKTAADLQLIVKNVQGLISLRDVEAIASGNEVVINDTMIAAGRIPSDWIKNGVVRHPFSGPLNVRIRWVSPSNQWIAIEFFNLAKSTCIKLTTKISSALSVKDVQGWNGTSGVLGRLQINWPSFDTASFPIPLETAETACTNATNNSIYSYFSFTRIN